jgi:hypothetical protein
MIQRLPNCSMRNCNSFAKIGSLLGLLVICGLLFLWYPANAQSPQSRLGAYGSINGYCGRDPIPQNADIIPWIGCFLLSAGHNATGMFSNHHVDLAVDATGQEVFAVDGTLIENVVGPQQSKSGTNLPFVHAGMGYSFCKDEANDPCPSQIMTLSRNPDKSVLFMVVECFPPENHACVSTQENWTYENSRRR